MTKPKTIAYGLPPSQSYTNYSITSPADMSGYTPTGTVIETVEYGLLAGEVAPPLGVNVAVQTSERWQTDTNPGPGFGFGTKTVTKTYYKSAPEDGGSSAAENVGMSRSTPAMSIQVTPIQRSILTHPKVKSIMEAGGLEAQALKALSMGASLGDYITGEDGIEHQISNMFSGEAMGLVMKADSYLDVQVKLTLSYQVPSADVAESDITVGIQAPPGIEGIKGRTWLFVGRGYSNNGGIITATETYMLSDVGGWDENIY